MKNPASGALLQLSVDPETALIGSAPPLLEILLGYEPGELAGMHISILKQQVSDQTGADTSQDALLQLFSDATHDLVGPLNQASALITLLTKKFHQNVDSDGELLLGHIATAVKRMGTLAEGLKFYSEILGSPNAIRDCDANALLTAVLSKFSRELESGQITVNASPLPAIKSDATQMMYVFGELIANAVKFRSESTPAIEITATQLANQCVFAVRDNGVGFDSHFNENVFRIFRRLNGDRYPGTGIGLAICRQVIHRHGGRMWAESIPNSGTTVYFTIMRAGEPQHLFP